MQPFAREPAAFPFADEPLWWLVETTVPSSHIWNDPSLAPGADARCQSNSSQCAAPEIGKNPVSAWLPSSRRTRAMTLYAPF